jgi:flagellar biosynthesis protein FliQ
MYLDEHKKQRDIEVTIFRVVVIVIAALLVGTVISILIGV